MMIKLTIDRFEEDQAVLKTDGGKDVIWPKDSLPAECREGSVLEFQIKDDKSAEEEKRGIAKQILNEILDVKD